LAGYKVGPPIDKQDNPFHDITTVAGRELVWDIIMKQKPKVIFLAPPCTPWSQMQNINDQLRVAEQQRLAWPILNFCRDVAAYQAKCGRYFIIENPSTSKI
jgi:site-specific DNA-cytosine methylase